MSNRTAGRSRSPETVVVCEKVGGFTELKRLTPETLEPWLAKYRLGELWIRGAIGGTNQVSKPDVLRRLDQATRKTKKGPYLANKGSHGFMILGVINPGAVESVAPSAKRLLDVLRAGGPDG